MELKNVSNMISDNIRNRIVQAIADDRTRYASDARHAVALGISAAVYSEIKKGDTEQKLSEAKWLAIARRLGVRPDGGEGWKTVHTPTFDYLTAQLELCRANGLSGMFCDIPNIGKTVAARYHAATHPNVVYVDCSQVKTRQRLFRHIAREFGLTAGGRYADVYDALMAHIRTLDRPQIILDEAGDLGYEALLEIKAAWNGTEGCCSWYLMGADGFKAKLERGVEFKTVGFAEIRSRCGDRYNSVTPPEGDERRQFLMGQALLVAQANAPAETDYRRIARRSEGSLRRVYTLITKGA